MADKEKQVEKAVKRKRGHFASGYQILTAGEVPPDMQVLVQVVSESEACATSQDVKTALTEKGLTGTFVVMRRTGDVVERVIKQVASFVTPKNVEGFDEAAETKEEE